MGGNERRLVVVLDGAITPSLGTAFQNRVVPLLRDAGELALAIGSGGGAVELALGLARFIASLKGPVSTYVSTHCASAAVMLFAAGTKRVIAPSGVLHVHELGIRLRGTQTISSLSATVMDLGKKTRDVTCFLEERTGRAGRLWCADMERSMTLSAAQAKRRGIATEIGHFEERPDDIVVNL